MAHFKKILHLFHMISFHSIVCHLLRFCWHGHLPGVLLLFRLPSPLQFLELDPFSNLTSRRRIAQNLSPTLSEIFGAGLCVVRVPFAFMRDRNVFQTEDFSLIRALNKETFNIFFCRIDRLEGVEEPYRPNAGVFVYLLQRKMWHSNLFQLKLDPQSTWSSMSAISWLGWKTSFSSLDADADIGVFDDLKNISLIFLCFNVSVFSMIFLWSQSGWRTRGTGFGTPWVKKYKIFCHRTARFYFSPSKLTRNLDFVSF